MTFESYSRYESRAAWTARRPPWWDRAMIEIDREALRPHYSRFLRDDRVLLTGHSHQAWPDVARQGLLEAFDDAARLADEKWAEAARAADAVRDAVAARIGAAREEIALGASTHELVARWLSALDLRRRPRIVTTRGEFHSLRRQLARLSEEGVEVVWVDPAPLESLSARLALAIDERTAALMASTVLFETSAVVPELALAVAAAQAHGAHVLLDAYHAFNAVPFAVLQFGADPIYIVGGGYKYAQWGEGCCFLRAPREPALRPIYTGWFSDFAALDKAQDRGSVAYGASPAQRFAGSTYDPSSHYRARAVIRFFDAHALSVERLRATSLQQTERLIDGLDGSWPIATPRAPDQRGAFVALRVPNAAARIAALHARGVLADARGDLLRLGPAPYVLDRELDRAIDAVRALGAR